MFALAHAEAPFVSPPVIATGLPGLPWQVFTSAVDLAVSRTARRYRLSPIDAEELRSDLWLQYIEDRRGLRERFTTLEHPERYLTRVARNMVLDGFIARYGRRRPSAAERRRLAEIEAAPAMLPLQDDTGGPRHPRRRFLGETALVRLESRTPSPFDERRRWAARSEARRLRRALRQGLTCLSPRHRELLLERYIRQRTVADIAATRNVQAPRLYREYESILGRVRRHLHDAGFDLERVREVLEQRGLEPASGT
jgi:RNA polymerase sigma factor (sigma-70 family)